MKGYFVFKRLFDILLSLLAIVILSPLFLIITLAILYESDLPIFFKQLRVGKNRKHFYIYKFRTMRTDTPRDMPTHLLENPDEFVTKVGKVLRKYSLDELPQLLNILMGDMSLIGPRPALWNQYDLITLRDKYGANDIKPGLTGLAQINGRDELPLQTKAWLDGEYTKKCSFLLDAKIIISTPLLVLMAKGVKMNDPVDTTQDPLTLEVKIDTDAIDIVNSSLNVKR